MILTPQGCKRYMGKAFTAENKDPKVLGNPAATYVCDKFPSSDLMTQLSINENRPVTCFVTQTDKKEDVKMFDIRYFLPNGEELNVCGHGTIFSSLAITKHYGKIKQIDFMPNQTLYQGLVKLNFDEIWRACIAFDKCTLLNLNINSQNLVKTLSSAFGIEVGQINDIKYCVENQDILITLKDAKTLRNMDVDSKESTESLKNFYETFKEKTIRSLAFSAPSNDKNYSYETRLINPSLDTNEDPACGSANMETATHWNSILNKNEMTVLYPHKYNKTGKFGGVQTVEVENGKIYVKGFAEFEG